MLARGHGDMGRGTRGSEAQRLGGPEEAELKGGSRGRPDDLLGNMTAALIPVSGFPMSY